MDDGITGRIYLDKIEGGVRPTACDACRSRLAVYELHWFDNSHAVRGLCQRCADEELATYQFDMARGMQRERARILDAELHQSAEELTRLAVASSRMTGVLARPLIQSISMPRGLPC